MKKIPVYLVIPPLVLMFMFCTFLSDAYGISVISRDPYIGAIVVDADTGRVLFKDHADARGYPASMVKIMDLLIILEAVQYGHLTLDEQVTVTARAARMGGSQVYLKEGEVFTVDELLKALMIQSANDAATALALHYAGTTAAFVDLMNKRAQDLGMKDTTFYSVHGLPPGRGERPDITTARDMARLCLELLKHPEALKYTSTKVCEFRPDADQPFIMRTHNHLLKSFDGCDGLKTGYFFAGGYSIAATAHKNGLRAIAVVLGSKNYKTRDRKTREVLSKGLMGMLMASTPSPPAAEAETASRHRGVAAAASVQEEEKNDGADGAAGLELPSSDSNDVITITIKKSNIKTALELIAAVFIFLGIFFHFKNNKRRKRRF